MFKKATKKDAKLRCAIFGASGSGKTYSALRMAKGMGGKIAFIDTEHGSACKYSDRFDFDVCDLDDKHIETYIKAIKGAGTNGYNVLIIDSLSHGWQQLLEDINVIANAKFKGNTWGAWSEGTPKQRGLISAILDFPGHLIATMRCKTEWSQEKTDRGTSRPIRVALAPEQGKGIEYEFDLLMEISTDHIANVIKDRTGKFQDKIIKMPDEEFGAELKAWLTEEEKEIPKLDAIQLNVLETAIKTHIVDIPAFMKYFKIQRVLDLPGFEFDKALAMVSCKDPKPVAKTEASKDDQAF